MQTGLAVLGALLWWVLYGSIGALFAALIAWSVLRWAERCTVVFNRTYLACLLWTLASSLLIVGVAAGMGRLQPPYAGLLASLPLRITLLVNMVLGTALLWWLIPRTDAHRIKPTSACLAVAVVVAIAYGAATSLGG